MSTPFLGQIVMTSFQFAPKGFALCNGQVLPINQNQALFSLLGTTYGGNGTTTFQLPNLQGRVPLHTGNTFPLGQLGGEEAHTLSLGEMPAHGHVVDASSVTANTANPVGSFLADSGNANYAPPADENGSFAAAAVGTDGGGQPHENRSPFLVISFAIALQGIFPSRS